MRVRKWTPAVNPGPGQIPILNKMSDQNLAPDPNLFQSQDPNPSLDRGLPLDRIPDLDQGLGPDPKLAATTLRAL